jgi:hypothetical protein
MFLMYHIRKIKDTTKRVMSMNVDGHTSIGRPMKRWMDCVKDDMRIKGMSMEMTSDRREWKRMEEENMLCRRHLVGEGDEDDDDDNK